MNPPAPSVTSLRLVGGDLALDFVNTVTGRFTAHPAEHLADFDHLLAWGAHAGVLDEQERAASLAAGRRESVAVGVHSRALSLREALFEAFSAVLDAAQVPSGAIATVDAELTRAARARQLLAVGSAVRWRWPADDPGLVLARVAEAAADLLTREPPPLLRRCAGAEHGCGWLFIDDSRGHRRRWCSMEVCGNRAKARAHRARAPA